MIFNKIKLKKLEFYSIIYLKINICKAIFAFNDSNYSFFLTVLYNR